MNATRRHTLWLVLFIVLLSGTAHAPVARAADGDAITWDSPEQLTSPEGRAWFPEIDAGVDGTVRLVWEEGSIRADLDRSDAGAAGVMLSTRVEDRWQAPRDIYVKDPYNAGRPIIASDSEYMYLLGRSFRDDQDSADTVMRLGGIYFTRAAFADNVENAQSWDQPVQLSRSSAYWGSIAVLEDGQLIVLYNEVVEYPESSGFTTQSILMSRRSPDQGATWDPPQRVSAPGTPAVRSSIAATGSGESVVICWDEGYDNLTGARGRRALYTAVSTDGGITWEDKARVEHMDPISVQLSFTARGRSEQCVVESFGDTTLLVYRSTMRDILLYRTSLDGGRTWSAEQVIPDAVTRPFLSEHHFDKLGLDVDSDGRFLVAYVGSGGNAASGLAVMVVAFKDGQWSKPEIVAAHDGYPEYPRIAVAAGNQVSIVYFVRDELYSDESPVSIWAVTGNTPASAVAPVDVEGPGEGAVNEPADQDEGAAGIEIARSEPVPPPPPPLQMDGGGVVAPQPALSQPIYQAAIATVVVLVLALAVFVTFRGISRARI